MKRMVLLAGGWLCLGIALLTPIDWGPPARAPWHAASVVLFVLFFAAIPDDDEDS